MQALDDLKAEATAAIKSAGDSAALEKLRVEWLGKKGRVTDLLKSLGQLDADERPKVGAEINAVKQLLNEQISERKETLQQAAIAAQLAAEALDVSEALAPAPALPAPKAGAGQRRKKGDGKHGI